MIEARTWLPYCDDYEDCESTLIYTKIFCKVGNALPWTNSVSRAVITSKGMGYSRLDTISESLSRACYQSVITTRWSNRAQYSDAAVICTWTILLGLWTKEDPSREGALSLPLHLTSVNLKI